MVSTIARELFRDEARAAGVGITYTRGGSGIYNSNYSCEPKTFPPIPLAFLEIPATGSEQQAHMRYRNEQAHAHDAAIFCHLKSLTWTWTKHSAHAQNLFKDLKSG